MDNNQLNQNGGKIKMEEEYKHDCGCITIREFKDNNESIICFKHLCPIHKVGSARHTKICYLAIKHPEQIK